MFDVQIEYSFKEIPKLTTDNIHESILKTLGYDKLLGRWTLNNNKTFEIWRFQSKEEFQERIQLLNVNSEFTKLRNNFQIHFAELETNIKIPKHIIAVSGLITDTKGKTLLVKSKNRKDTWELPGGQVELGENLQLAAYREIYEETGVRANLDGIYGVFSNLEKNILVVVFKGTVSDNSITIYDTNEILEAAFIKINPSNIEQFVKRKHLLDRIINCLEATSSCSYDYN